MKALHLLFVAGAVAAAGCRKPAPASAEVPAEQVAAEQEKRDAIMEQAHWAATEGKRVREEMREEARRAELMESGWSEAEIDAHDELTDELRQVREALARERADRGG